MQVQPKLVPSVLPSFRCIYMYLCIHVYNKNWEGALKQTRLASASNKPGWGPHELLVDVALYCSLCFFSCVIEIMEICFLILWL